MAEDADKTSAFRTATELHAAEGALFGMRPEQVAKTLTMQGVWLHIDAKGHDATVAFLKRLIKITEAERDEPAD